MKQHTWKYVFSTRSSTGAIGHRIVIIGNFDLVQHELENNQMGGNQNTQVYMWEVIKF